MSQEKAQAQSTESQANTAVNAEQPASPTPQVVDGTAAVPAPQTDVVAEEVAAAEAVNEPVFDNLVHQGKDDWLFLVGGSNTVLDLYKHESSFTEELANEWMALLKERTERLQAEGIEYLHIPAPEKLSVLHKYYDGELENVDNGPIAKLGRKNAANIASMVNVLPYFARQIDDTLLYWKTDTHWSFWGCYAAYQLLCSRLGVEHHNAMLKYPFLKNEVLFDLGAKLDEPRKEEASFYQLTQTAKRTYANPIVRFKEEQNLVDDSHLHVGSHVVFKNDGEHAVDKCVVLFGDSFSEYREHLLTGMLAETFREVHFIWNPSIDYEYVKLINPDIVVTELAERFMTRVPEDKLDIQSFAAERLADYKIKAINGDPSMGFALPESVILEKIIMPSETYHLDPPNVVQEDCVNVDNDREMKSHPIRLVEVENPKVFFNGGRCIVRAPGGEIVVRYRVDDDEADELPWKQYRHVEGTVMMFGNSMGAHCYYHWMLDLLPKMGLLEKAGIPLSSIDYFLVREMNG